MNQTTIQKTLTVMTILLGLTIIVPATVSADEYYSCTIEPSCSGDRVKVGDVTDDGHYAENSSVGLYNLCCNEVIFDENNSEGWRWSDNAGMGHVQEPNRTVEYDFLRNITSTTPAEARAITGSLNNTLDDDEACMFRMSNGSNAHIAGCKNTSAPPGAGGENFDTVLANPLTEVCDNSRDDTLDGSADCADTACHPSPENNNKAQECTGNNQTTEDCINSTTGEIKDWCKNNQTGDAYYCSYGVDDDNTTALNGSPTADPEGFCCPEGQRALENPATGKVECQSFSQCYSEFLADPTCEFDFENTTERYFDWFNEEYNGSSYYCVSARTDYYANIEGGGTVEDRSSACCRINKHGKSGYYFDEGNNVKIFG